MSTKAQIKALAKTPAAPAAGRIPQPPVPELEHEAEWPDITAQLEGATRLGHRFGALGVDHSPPPIIQRQEIPEEEEEELQLKREPAAIQRQELPEEEEEELMMKPEEGRVGPQGGQVPPEVEAAIKRARGGGQPLEGVLQEQMSASLGHDFSRVRVHTDAEADGLNRQLSAKAFTTGPDIFFKRGAYDPGSGGGRELIAHELSHVVQQASGRMAGLRRRMTVRPAGDILEQEAAGQARQVAQQRAGASPGMALPDAIPTQQRPVGNRAGQRCPAQCQRGENGGEVWHATDGGHSQAGRASVSGSEGGRRQFLVPWCHKPTAAVARGLLARRSTAETRSVQRELLVDPRGKPFPEGAIVACTNPSARGHEIVKGARGGAAYPVPGKQDLTHAGILSGGGQTIIEAMGPGVRRTPVEGHPAQTFALASTVVPGFDVAPADIHAAAVSGIRIGGEYKTTPGPHSGELAKAVGRKGIPGTEIYGLRMAEAAVEKGDLEWKREELLSGLAKGKGDQTGVRQELQEVEAELGRLKARWGDLPGLVQGKGGPRPSGATYCVMYVVQAVQAAVKQKLGGVKEREWLLRVGYLPTVRDLVGVLSPSWEEAEGADHRRTRVVVEAFVRRARAPVRRARWGPGRRARSR